MNFHHSKRFRWSFPWQLFRRWKFQGWNSAVKPNLSIDADRLILGSELYSQNLYYVREDLWECNYPYYVVFLWTGRKLSSAIWSRRIKTASIPLHRTHAYCGNDFRVIAIDISINGSPRTTSRRKKPSPACYWALIHDIHQSRSQSPCYSTDFWGI